MTVDVPVTFEVLPADPSAPTIVRVRCAPQIRGIAAQIFEYDLRDLSDDQLEERARDAAPRGVG